MVISYCYVKTHPSTGPVTPGRPTGGPLHCYRSYSGFNRTYAAPLQPNLLRRIRDPRPGPVAAFPAHHLPDPWPRDAAHRSFTPGQKLVRPDEWLRPEAADGLQPARRMAACSIEAALGPS